MTEIEIPFNWRPRKYQRRLWSYLQNGGTRAVPVWHRRSGKDEVFLHWTARSSLRRRGNYWHMLPEAAQARKAIWDAVNPHTGKKRIDEAFPPQIRAGTNGTEMKIELVSGSIWQLVGSDNFNSLIGSPPVGLVFSEYAVANPRAWDYLRPILAENGGWAGFPSTPRGKNHLWTLYEMATGNPAWFAERLTVDDTGVLGPAVIAEERASGMSEDEIRQEYYSDFNAAIKGAYYGKLMREADQQGRIGKVPWDPKLLVHTSWDLGISDSMAIWFWQLAAGECRLIDYYESFGMGLEHYAKVLKEKPYVYGDHIAPHDADVADLSTGHSRQQTMAGYGIHWRVMPRVGQVSDRIAAARGILPRCWFDAEKCERGIEALRQYSCDYNPETQIFSDRPKHDWTSHGADSFGEGARGLPDQSYTPPKRERYTRHSKHGGTWMSS